jgi:peptidoglycan/xylan/chitin deacetylase (PgdA/CDA1 family)
MNTSIGAVRWRLKKVSRPTIAHCSRIVRAAWGGKGASCDFAARALTYHRFGTIACDPFCLSPHDFAKQMRYIARAGLPVSLVQLEAFLNGLGELPHDAVLVTVDDGFRSLLGEALPVLQEYAIPAVAFVSAALIASRRDSMNSAPENYLDWDDLELLAKSGVSIQSHGWTHRSLAHLHPEEARQELSRSRRLLEERLGTPVTALAYPFGTRRDFNSDVATMAAASGYRFGFTSQHGPIRRGDNSLVLNRVKVESGDSLATFASLVHGGLDAWRWIDQGLWRLQSSRS